MSPTEALDRVKELRQVLQTKRSNLQGLSTTWKMEGDKFVVSTEQKALFEAAVAEADSVLSTLKMEEKAAGIFEYLDAAPPGAGGTAQADAASGFVPQTKSLADSWLGSEEYKTAGATSFRELPRQFQVDSGIPRLAAAAEAKDIYTAMGGRISIPALGRAQNLGFTERTLRPGRVRDLFPAEATDAQILYGIRETGYTNRARVVPERTAADGTAATGGITDVYGLKPKSDLTIVPVTYPLATIAHIMYVHRQTLADEPRMRGIIDRDMIDGIKMSEDEALLYGDGIGDNLTGLVNTQGIQVYTGADPAAPATRLHPKDKKSAQIRRAATLAMLAYFTPTGVVMHPFDWEDVELEVDANGAYTVAVSVAVGGEKRVWRMNVVESPAMQQGRYLTGAFGTGAKIYDREQVNVQVSTENRDLFERNAVTLRAEERLGLVVDRPESFVYGTFFVPAP